MSFSNQKMIQHYLQKHEVGQLFEDMMAKVVKDMPNDPISYLLRLLQRLHQKRNSDGSQKPNTAPPKSELQGLVGSSVPKKLSKDPQVVLPGSKQVVSAWATGHESNNNKNKNADISKNKKQQGREYQKPWLAGAKTKKNHHDTPTSWSGDVASRTLDEGEMSYFKEQKKSNKLLQSAPVNSLKDVLNPAAGRNKENSWKDNNKENLNTMATPPRLTSHNTYLDDELDRQSLSCSPKTSKQTFSPATYAKFKKQSSKKKSLEQKTKLQALLSNGDKSNQRRNLLDDEEDSSNDEGIEIIESASDLTEEGARSKSSVGMKKQIYNRKEETNRSGVNISVCSQCAKVVPQQLSLSKQHSVQSSFDLKSEVSDTEALFKPTTSRGNQFSFIQTDDDDFESVSQINVNGPYKPKWPSLEVSEGEETEDNIMRRRPVKHEKEEIKIKKKVSMKQNIADIETDKSDFFTTNSPLRKKNRSFNLNPESGNESVATLPPRTQSTMKSSTKSSKSKQAWKQQAIESESEIDTEDNTLDLKASSRRALGWNKKLYTEDDFSD